MFVGRKFDDRKILGFAYAFEQVVQDMPKADPCVYHTLELTDEVGRNKLSRVYSSLQN